MPVMMRLETVVYNSRQHWKSYLDTNWFRCRQTYANAIVSYGSFRLSL